jgi:hypothetical protein
MILICFLMKYGSIKTYILKFALATFEQLSAVELPPDCCAVLVPEVNATVCEAAEVLFQNAE